MDVSDTFLPDTMGMGHIALHEKYCYHIKTVYRVLFCETLFTNCTESSEF